MVFPPLAVILLNGRDWLLPLGLLLGLALLVILFAYLRRPAGTHGLPFLLKACGFTLLTLCLLEPTWIREVTGEEAEQGVHRIALLIDNSRSLQIGGRDAVLRETLEKAFDDPDAWPAKLEETFQMRHYHLADRLTRMDHPVAASLDFSGPASAVYRSLASLVKRHQGQPLAGVVLITDGNVTDAQLEINELPPVYPVVVQGNTPPAPDTAVGNVTISQTAFEDAPVTISIELRTQQCKGRTVRLSLIGDGNEELQTETRVAASDRENLGFRFLFRPRHSGVSNYRLETIIEDTDEPTLDNNVHHLVVNRGQGPYRILYVSGRPNWEFKFLNRALRADPEIELVGLIRMARREPKFAFRGNAGESSNPLFRGADQGDDTDYDQPVLIRMNTLDETELAAGFPKEARDLFKYHALIIDDLESEFFTVDQMEAIEDFVSRRGGGFLMLGGQESFYHGNYHGTPIDALLPVYVQKPDSTRPATAPTRLLLTREGWLQPWVRLRETESAEKKRLETMTPFLNVNRVRAIKPGTSVIANVLENGETRPALAVQRFGDGRVAALMVADFWRWGFREPDQREDMEKAWRQMIRWLTADVPEQVELQQTQNGPRVDLQVRPRDENFDPRSDVEVTLRLYRPGNEDAAEGLEMRAQPSMDQAGMFEAAFHCATAGAYRVEVDVTDHEGEVVGTSETGWTYNPDASEFAALQPNREAMQALAEQTGGELLDLDDLGSLPKRIEHPTVEVTRVKTTALWHVPIVFLLAIACFVAEWALRRSRGLA